MKPAALEKVRNFGIAAHIDAGKTTTSERILYYTGRQHKLGDIDEGNTTLDWMEEERERGITITSAATTCFWKGHQLNLIDTPGHVDFTVEVERSLRVLDGAVGVYCGVGGVEAQSETVWRQMEKYRVPRLCFINKLDRTGANPKSVLEEIRTKLGANAAFIQLPIGLEGNHKGVVDIITGKGYVFHDDELGAKFDEIDTPADMADEVKKYRDELIEKVGENDDAIMEKFVAGEPVSVEELKTAIRRVVIQCKFSPVLVGSAFKNKGVQMLLDAICDYLPSPLEKPPAKGINPDTKEPAERDPKETTPTAALAFKIVSDPHGDLTYIRIYSGKLESGQTLLNPRRGKKERITHLYRMHANQREKTEALGPGEICAVVGLKDVVTGDTLCDLKDPILLEPPTFAQTVISMAIEPKLSADRDKLSEALTKLAKEDPTFQRHTDKETGELIISGMGELHLEVKQHIMEREYGIGINVGAPRVAYKETITGTAETEGKFIRQTGGRGQYGHVVLSVKPLTEPCPDPILFENKIKQAAIPREYIPAVEKGVREAAENGVIAGYPAISIHVQLLDGSYHEVDSNELAFSIAGSMAFQEAVKKATPILLEPIMKLEVVCPEEFLGDVLGDLNARRSAIQDMSARGGAKVITAHVPLSEMFGYTTRVRSLTQGRAVPNMEPLKYAQVPGDKQRQIVEAASKKQQRR